MKCLYHNVCVYARISILDIFTLECIQFTLTIWVYDFRHFIILTLSIMNKYFLKIPFTSN